jgi:diacylglycerol kinase (ATP)
MHAWRLAEAEIDLTKFDGLVAVGGDGTLHEVVNGLLRRKDGLKVPIGFVPNGSGNDTCHDLGIGSVELAIDFILKGETVKIDVNRVIMDAETEDSIPEQDRESRMRYSLINASIGFIAKCVWRGLGLKRYFGNFCYQAAAVYEMSGTQKSEDYAIELDQADGSTLTIPLFSTEVAMIMNGKSGGTHIPFTPMAMMNDGLLDILFMKGHFKNLLAGVGMLSSAKDYHGLHVYQDTMVFLRGNKVKITNLNYEPSAETVEIDGDVSSIQQV